VPDCVQVTTTLPDEKLARHIATRLVEDRLAACAQVLGPVSSSYWWQGRVEGASEWYCHIKTTRANLTAVQQTILELHPYEVPEIIAVTIAAGNAEYLRWIEETCVPTLPRSGERNTGSVVAPAASRTHGRSNTRDDTGGSP
jgi:periplasmic divalent cation tolerance protein